MDTTKALVLKQFGLAKGISYSETANAFLTPGYTSVAGNTYYNAIRFAEGIVIKEDIGQGWAHTFLNGVRIYSLKDKTLLADRSFHSYFYSKTALKNEAVAMLMEVLQKAATKEGYQINKEQARKEIEKIVDTALNTNQIEMLQTQSQKYLTR